MVYKNILPLDSLPRHRAPRLPIYNQLENIPTEIPPDMLTALFTILAYAIAAVSAMPVAPNKGTSCPDPLLCGSRTG